MGDALALGCYTIMRKIPGYRIEHFLKDSFHCSQYFLLVDMIRDEAEAERKAIEKSNKDRGKK